MARWEKHKAGEECTCWLWQGSIVLVYLSCFMVFEKLNTDLWASLKLVCGCWAETPCKDGLGGSRLSQNTHNHTQVLICKYTQGYKPFSTPHTHMCSTNEQCALSTLTCHSLLPLGGPEIQTKIRGSVHPPGARHVLRAIHGHQAMAHRPPREFPSLSMYFLSSPPLWWERTCLLPSTLCPFIFPAWPFFILLLSSGNPFLMNTIIFHILPTSHHPSSSTWVL